MWRPASARRPINWEVSHSTLADTNRERNWRIYYDLAQQLIRRARILWTPKRGKA